MKDPNWVLRRRQKGFTLVELLVVIAIIGVLATLVLLQLGTARARARDTQRIATVNQVRSAIELYADANNGAYPASATMTALCTALETGGYLSKCPTDLTSYGYAYTATPRRFVVWSALELNAAALQSDADINSTGWTGQPRNDSTDPASGANCTGAFPGATNCVYSQGVK